MFFLSPLSLSLGGIQPFAQTPQDIDFRVLIRHEGLSFAEGDLGDRLLLAEFRQLRPQGVAILTHLQQSLGVEPSGTDALLLGVCERREMLFDAVDRRADFRRRLQTLREEVPRDIAAMFTNVLQSAEPFW